MADNNQLVYTIELRNGNLIKDINAFIKKNQEGANSIEGLVEANKKLIEVAKLATDRSSEGFKKLAAQISANKAEVVDLKTQLKKDLFDKFVKEIKESITTLDALKDKQKELNRELGAAKFGSEGYIEVQQKLRAVNTLIKEQRDETKATSAAIKKQNEFAQGSYGKLKEEIKQAKSELDKYAIGSSKYQNVQAKLNSLLKEEERIREGTKYEELRSEIDRTANTIEGLRLKQRLLKEAFEKQEIDSKGYVQLQQRLKDVNAELKNQLDTVKKNTQSLGGINESVKFAKGSYGELRQEIKKGKDELQKYTIGSKQYEKAQKDLNALLQKEVDIRRTQPSLFQTRITAAINESDAVKKLQVSASKLRLEESRLAQASKENANAQAEVRRELEKTAASTGKSSKKYKELERELKSLEAQEERNVKEFKKIRTELGKTNSAISSASKGVSGFSKNLKAVGAVVVAKLGFDLVKEAFISTVRAGSLFEQKLKDVQAVSGATAQELRKIEQVSLELGGSTQFTASEVAELAKEYSKLGFSIQEIVSVAPGTLDLATATGTSLQKSAEITGSTLRAFQLDVSETGRVVDVLARSTSNSALDMTKLENSLTVVAPIAQQANIDIESLTAALGSLANIGISGSRAGTALRTVISDISNSSSKLAKELGYTVKSGSDLIKAFKDLKKAGLDNAKAQELVGRESQAVLTSLVSQVDKVEELAEAYDNASGSAENIASIQRDSLNVSFQTFLSAIEKLQISITKYLNGPLKGLISGMTSVVNLFNDFIQIPVSEELEDERKELNKLVLAIQVTNENQENRQKLIDELQAKYPDFLKNMDAEKVSNEQLADRLENVNRIMQDNIRLQIEEEKLSVAKAKREAEAQNRIDAQRKLTELLIQAEKEYGITIKTVGSNADIAADAFEQLRAKQTAFTLDLNFFAKSFGNALNAFRTTEISYTDASNNLTEAIGGKVSALRTYVQDTGDAKAKTELLKLELESLNKEFSQLSAEGADANRIADVAKQIKATQEELSSIEINVPSASNAEATGAETAKDFAKGFASQITLLQKRITTAIEAEDFGLAKRLTVELERFGEEGAEAAKRSYERILKAQLQYIDTQNQLNQTLLEAEHLRNEQSLSAYIEAEKKKLEELDNINNQKEATLIRFASTEAQVQQQIADKSIQFEESKLQAFLQSANKKLEVLRAAGKAESLEYERIQLEILKAQESFETFKAQRIEDLNDQFLETTIRNKAQEIELMREGNKKLLAELQLNQAERLKEFQTAEETRLQEFAKSQAEYQQKIETAGYAQTVIERKLAGEREAFIKEKEQREQALREKFAQERIQLARETLVKESQLAAEFIDAASEKSGLEIDISIAEQIRGLQEQLKEGEISLEQFEQEAEKIEAKSLEAFREKQKERTEALIVELEKQAALLATGSEEEILESERIKNEILRIKKDQIESEVAIVEKGLEEEGDVRRKWLEGIRGDLERIGQVIDIASDFFEASANNKIASIDRQIGIREKNIEDLQQKAENANEQEKLSIEAKIKSEETLLENLDKKREDIERKQFEREKAQNIAKAIIEGALLYIQTLSKPVLLPYVIAATAAQVALIASTTYEIGGLIGDVIQSAVLRQSLWLKKLAKGDILSDGLQVASPGHIPNRRGIISGPSHAQGGVKGVTKAGKLIEVEGGEPTTVQGSGQNAIRLIYNKRVAQNQFLKKVALMTESGTIDPVKLAVGSFINSMTGGKDFFNVTSTFGKEGMQFKYGGSLADKMTPNLPISVIYRYQSGGGIGSSGSTTIVNTTNDELMQRQIEATEKQNRLIAEQNMLLRENTREVQAVSGAIGNLEADATIPFTKKITATQQKIQSLQNNAK